VEGRGGGKHGGWKGWWEGVERNTVAGRGGRRGVKWWRRIGLGIPDLK
jgi:hypothetical protein